MARLPLATIFGCLLACTVMLALATGDDAEGAARENPGVALNRRKLEHIIIPKLEFRDATLREAIDFLAKKCVELDDSPAGNRGLNIVMKLEAADGQGSDGVSAIPGVPNPTGTGATWRNPAEARITVSLTHVSLLEALRYVTALANLKLKIDPDRVYIVSSDAPVGEIITKEWKIPRDLIPGLPDPAKDNAASGEPKKNNVDREIAKNWLIANGVIFNGPASAVYIVRSSRLIVRNTQDQVDLVDSIISPTVGNPSLVEIECRLVEIQQDELKDLNFETMVSQFNTQAAMKAFTKGRVEVTPKAIEWPAFPRPAAIFGIFTDPQYQLAIRVLAQKKGCDYVSMPKVTVNNGQPAVIEFVRQYGNPPEDAPPQVRKVLLPAHRGETDNTAATSQASHATRNVAVTLEIKPVIGPDGYTLDLTLSGQVTESDGIVGYGSPFTSSVNHADSGASQRNIITPELVSHPVFSTRKMPAAVSILDGTTVVFGDLLGEDTKETVIGPFAQIKSDKPGKRKLAAFITAHFINPGSSPIRSDDDK